MRRAFGIGLGILMAASVALATGGEGKVKASVTGPEKPLAGKPFELAVELEVKEGYHIQADTVKDPNIPTKVVITAPEGFKAGAPVFPASKTIESFGEKLQAFDGKITVKVPITPPAAAKGKQEFTVKVTYQACNAETCDPPVDVTASCDVTLPAAAKAPVKAAPKKKPGRKK